MLVTNDIDDKVLEYIDQWGEIISSIAWAIRASYHITIIPSPKLLIKDHKKPNKNGEFPTRLVIPATNFTATFAKVEYLGLKSILDIHQENLKKYTITQASQVEEYWEKLEWKREKVTVE